MVLGTDQIIRELDLGCLTCIPAPAQVEGTHIDVHVGSHTWTMKPWWKRPFRSIDLKTDDPVDWFDYKFVLPFEPIKLPPRRLVLCHTEELIGSESNRFQPELGGRSTAARWGLMVHLVAGDGDPGYATRWTLELLNTTSRAMLLPVGAKIGRVKFTAISGVPRMYEDGYNKGMWTSRNMLPRKGNW